MSDYIVRERLSSFSYFLYFFFNYEIKLKFSTPTWRSWWKTIPHIRFTFSVTLGFVSFCTNVEFMAEVLTNTLTGPPWWQLISWLLIFVKHEKTCSQKWKVGGLSKMFTLWAEITIFFKYKMHHMSHYWILSSKLDHTVVQPTVVLAVWVKFLNLVRTQQKCF
jgi:hypothetical protein